jgi:transcriptional regulator with XRE-family HTH domain
MNQLPEIPPLPDYAANIHLARKRQQLSLEQLSQRSGVSKALLSQIETGKVNPTVGKLWQIAHALRLEVDELLRDPTEEERHFEVNRGNQITSVAVPECGTVFRAISPISMADDLEFYHVTQEPHCVHKSPPHQAGTEELIAVLKGSIKVTAGKNTAELHKGDFLAFAADLHHTITTTSAEHSEFQMVVRFAK